ncbi:beta-N-acetylglucosaminidase domain-containing protein [Sunxiuqinia rutila]|uniref:beta-N-acetylglucosaminidase domain-containing protein n=1 Tax=Sunxiuqinia rutila TaxID=1397841 RepID=UPI003D35E057
MMFRKWSLLLLGLELMAATSGSATNVQVEVEETKSDVAALLADQRQSGFEMPDIYPVPQQVNPKGENVLLKKGRTSWKLSDQLDAASRQLLHGMLDGFSVKVVAALAGEPGTKNYSKVPEQAEGYFLAVSAKKIILVGRDAAGVFYAAQSLSQLLEKTEDGLSLPAVEIVDWPDVEFRGTVEGFYGKPWSHADRLSQLEFYGKYKLNTYIYGPKDDPFHGFSDQWREPYPDDKAAQITELAETALQNQINFVWAVHPGRDIHWTDTDGDGLIDDFVACLQKFEMMYELGVRSFAVFFDDISGEGTDASRQAEMLNYLNAEFVRKKDDVTPLIMCPTQYNRAWSGGDYLSILGKQLDHDINIMWTGNSVCADIERDGMDWINAQINRKAFIWWNWPVSDYVRTRLLLGRTYGLDPNNLGTLSGFASNPMDKPEASKIGLFGVADYTWNMAGFQSQQSWIDGILRLFPELHNEMLLFASHNSDQGPNSHGYRREESVAILPYTSAALASCKEQNNMTDSVKIRLKDEFDHIIQAAHRLQSQLPEVNPALYDELEYWLLSFEALGRAGKETMALAEVSAAQPEDMFSQINKVFGQLQAMEQYSHQQKLKGAPDRWARGCEVGGTVLTPFVNQLFQQLAQERFAKFTGNQYADIANDSQEQYQLLTSVEALKRVPVSRQGKFVTIKPMLEVIALQPDDFIGIELPDGIYANYIHLKLDNPEVSERGEVQVSTDGVEWKTQPMHSDEAELQARLDQKHQIRYIRFRNKSEEKLELKVNQFKVDVPEDARINSETALSDGDLFSFYTVPQSSEALVIPKPETASGSQVWVVGDTSGVEIIYANGTRVHYSDKTADKSQKITGVRILNSKQPTQLQEIIWE